MPRPTTQHQACYPGLLVAQRRETPILDWFHKYRVTACPPSTTRTAAGSRRAHLPLLRRGLALQRRPVHPGQGAHLVDLARLPAGSPPHRRHDAPSTKTVAVYMQGMNGDNSGPDGNTPDAAPASGRGDRPQRRDDHRLRPVRRLHAREGHLQRRHRSPAPSTTSGPRRPPPSTSRTPTPRPTTSAPETPTPAPTSPAAHPSTGCARTTTTYDDYGMAATVDDAGDTPSGRRDLHPHLVRPQRRQGHQLPGLPHPHGRQALRAPRTRPSTCPPTPPAPATSSPTPPRSTTTPRPPPGPPPRSRPRARRSGPAAPSPTAATTPRPGRRSRRPRTTPSAAHVS